MFKRSVILLGLVIAAVEVAPLKALAGVLTAEYRLPSRVDADILSGIATELWAEVNLPSDFLTPSTTKRRYPLVVLLHGNAPTCVLPTPGSRLWAGTSCEYTQSGTCTAPYQPLNSHVGYHYLAEALAERGMIVVSVNANRGINCSGGNSGDDGLILARGRLVLRHLQEWANWSTTGGAPLELGAGAGGFVDRIDWDHLGLFGHSRGGEGVRAALALYRDANSIWKSRIPGAEFRAIFEIGAVDGQSSRTLNAEDVAWVQLLPLCDGDVSNLEGVLPFQRMLRALNEKRGSPKSVVGVWGANHNHFNSEWTSNDAEYNDCPSAHRLHPIYGSAGSSSEQQAIAGDLVPRFFDAHLNGHTAQLPFQLGVGFPPDLLKITRLDFDHIDSVDGHEHLVLENFDDPTGANAWGGKNEFFGVDAEFGTEPWTNQSSWFRPAQVEVDRVGVVQNQQQSSAHSLILNWTNHVQGNPVDHFKFLEFRASQLGVDWNLTTPLSDQDDLDFGIFLVDENGRELSKSVRLKSYVSIIGPPHTSPLMSTVRIPLADFGLLQPGVVAGVKFEFDAANSLHQTMLSQVRFSGALMPNVGAQPPRRTPLLVAELGGRGNPRSRRFDAQFFPPPRTMGTAEIHAYQVVSEPFVGPKVSRKNVEIHVRSSKDFPLSDNLPVLVIGDREFSRSRWASPTRMDGLIFSIPWSDFRALVDGSEVRVQYGRGRLATKVWSASRFEKSALEEIPQ